MFNGKLLVDGDGLAYFLIYGLDSRHLLKIYAGAIDKDFLLIYNVDRKYI